MIAIRTREVASPSARAEGWLVGRAAIHVALWCALWSSASSRAAPRLEAPARAASEVTFAELAPEEQRLYRALHEGLGEAARRRAASGLWPDAAELARDGIPPFAPDPLDRAGFVWTSAISGALVNYVGVARAEPARTAFVGIASASAALVTITVWKGPPPASPPRAVSAPDPGAGYQQILGGPR